jgi:hypothetical protein
MVIVRHWQCLASGPAQPGARAKIRAESDSAAALDSGPVRPAAKLALRLGAIIPAE